MPNLDYRGPKYSIASPRIIIPMRFAAQVVIVVILHTPLMAIAAEPPLPQLGNTALEDRPLLREISDRHIHSSNPEHTESGNALRPSKRSGKSPQRIVQTAWELVRTSTRMQIPDQELVAFYRKQYHQEAIYVTRTLVRATPYIGYVVDELDKRYLPVELALLPAIESGYRPDVHSSKDAAGIWQIIPSTATDMGIDQTSWFDGRSDIQQSTQAATKYLSYLNGEFHGDWLLTLAAYNAGPGRVRAAVKRNTRAGLPIDFWSLSLPRETRHYVPKFLALVAMMRYDNPPGLEIPAVARGSAFDVVDVRQRIGLNRLAAITQLPEDSLRTLNAGLVRGITPPRGPHLLYVPQGFGTPLINSLMSESALMQSTPAGTHRVVSGDTISSIAQSYAIPVATLIELNELSTDVIRVGQTLWVHDSGGHSSHVEYVVSIGDTLSDIAKRFSMPVADIRDERGKKLTSEVIHPGEKLSLLAPSRRSAGD